MKQSVFRIITLAIAVSAFEGCTAFDTPAAQPGMSRRETEALVRSYYWQRKWTSPSYSDAQLDALLAHSADPKLDGERAEEQAAAVAVALTVVGDQRFARALSRQSHKVQEAVNSEILYLWTYYRLDYPQTQALLQGQTKP